MIKVFFPFAPNDGQIEFTVVELEQLIDRLIATLRYNTDGFGIEVKHNG